MGQWKRKDFFPLFLVGFKVSFSRSICFCFGISFFMSYENTWRVLFSGIIAFSLLPFALLPLTFFFSTWVITGMVLIWDKVKNSLRFKPKWLCFKSNLFLELPIPHQCYPGTFFSFKNVCFHFDLILMEKRKVPICTRCYPCIF